MPQRRSSTSPFVRGKQTFRDYSAQHFHDAAMRLQRWARNLQNRAKGLSMLSLWPNLADLRMKYIDEEATKLGALDNELYTDESIAQREALRNHPLVQQALHMAWSVCCQCALAQRAAIREAAAADPHGVQHSGSPSSPWGRSQGTSRMPGSGAEVHSNQRNRSPRRRGGNASDMTFDQTAYLSMIRRLYLVLLVNDEDGDGRRLSRKDLNPRACVARTKKDFVNDGGGKDYLTRDEFDRCWFQLTDLNTEEISGHASAKWIYQMLAAISTWHQRPREEKPKIVWKPDAEIMLHHLEPDASEWDDGEEEAYDLPSKPPPPRMELRLSWVDFFNGLERRSPGQELGIEPSPEPVAPRGAMQPLARKRQGAARPTFRSPPPHPPPPIRTQSQEVAEAGALYTDDESGYCGTAPATEGRRSGRHSPAHGCRHSPALGCRHTPYQQTPHQQTPHQAHAISGRRTPLTDDVRCGSPAHGAASLLG